MRTCLTGYFVIYCVIIINGQTYIENTYIDTVYDVWTMDGPYESNDFAVPGCNKIPANTPFHGPFHDERQRFYQIFRCLHESDVTIYYSEAFGCGTNDVTQDYIELIVNGESKLKSSRDIISNLDGHYSCGLEYQAKCQHNRFLVHDRVVALGTFTPNDDIRVEFETRTNQPDEELIVALVRVECVKITETPTNNPSKTPSMNPTIVPTNNPTQIPSALPTEYPSVTPTGYITSTTTGHTTTYSPSQNPTLIRNVVIQFWENQWLLIGIISMTVTLILCCVVLFCIYMLRNANNKESNIINKESNNNSSISTVIIPNQIINNSNDNKNNIFSTMNTTVEGIPKNPELIISDIITPSNETPKGTNIFIHTKYYIHLT